MDGAALEFTHEALQCIAKRARKRGTGARALRSIIEDLMRDLLFDLPDRPDIKQYIVTPEMVRLLDIDRQEIPIEEEAVTHKKRTTRKRKPRAQPRRKNTA